MITLTITIEEELAQVFQPLLDRRSMTAEEFVKQALYHYLTEDQSTRDIKEQDSLVGLFDLGDPLLSEKSEQILQATVTPPH